MPFTLSATNERRLTDESKRIIGLDFATVGVDAPPPWVTGTTATADGPMFNAESPDLLRARERIAAALRGRASCEILVMGDSKSAAYQGQVVPWPEQARRMLAAVDGFIQGSDGLLDPRWSVVGLQQASTTGVGLVSAAGATTRSATVTLTEPVERATLYARIPGGGSATLTIDGTAQTITIPNTAGWHPIPVDDGDLVQTISLSATVDLAIAGVTLHYDEPTLTISNPSRPSSSAADWSTTAATGRWETVVDGPATNPSVIFCALGANDIDNLDALTALAVKLKALDKPVILIAPGGMGGGTHPPADGSSRGTAVLARAGQRLAVDRFRAGDRGLRDRACASADARQPAREHTRRSPVRSRRASPHRGHRLTRPTFHASTTGWGRSS